MPVTRRDILWTLGGGLAGAVVSPVPWKLLDDTAIWTQRRHALPVPARGPVSFRADKNSGTSSRPRPLHPTSPGWV